MNFYTFLCKPILGRDTGRSKVEVGRSKVALGRCKVEAGRRNLLSLCLDSF